MAEWGPVAETGISEGEELALVHGRQAGRGRE